MLHCSHCYSSDLSVLAFQHLKLQGWNTPLGAFAADSDASIGCKQHCYHSELYWPCMMSDESSCTVFTCPPPAEAVGPADAAADCTTLELEDDPDELDAGVPSLEGDDEVEPMEDASE